MPITERRWSLGLWLEGDGVDVWVDARRLTLQSGAFAPALGSRPWLEAWREAYQGGVGGSRAPGPACRHPSRAMSWMFKR